MRVAVVLPLAFAFALVVLDAPQTALFAAFGSIALLVFVEFGGPRRDRLLAFALLALAGLALIAVGTLCSQSPALSTAAMAALGFLIVFSGLFSGYAAAAQTAAVLVLVLALMVPAGAGEIPERLGGWAIAAVLAAAASLLVWWRRPPSAVRRRAAAAARALAEEIEHAGGAEAAAIAAEAGERVLAARRDFLALGQRPTGTGGRTAALGRLIEDLGWVQRCALGPAAPESERLAAERATIAARAPTVLRNAARRLQGDGPAPGADAALAELDRVHDELGRATLARLRGPGGADPAREAEATRELDEIFRLRLLCFSVVACAAAAREALGERLGEGAWTALVEGDLAAGARAASAGVAAGRRLFRAHAGTRSVWLRNSLRAALGLALAVLIAQLADVQHGFWVVLGTLSVLRSSALATGTRIGWALLGTLAGIVAGSALLLAVGDSEAALWALLPFAALLAGYAPRAVSFGAGQAGFSVLVLILFNLLEPSGWQVGLVRIEDVAIGAGVSLLVGLLLWPRGAGPVLRGAIADAYASAAELVEGTIAALLRGGRRPPDLARAAFEAGQLLDATARDYVADRGSRTSLQDLSQLLHGAHRLRQAAHMLDRAAVLARLGPVPPSLPRAERARRQLEAGAEEATGWFEALARSVAAAAPPPAPAEPRRPPPVVLEREAGAGDLPPGVAIAWAGHYLTMLEEMEPALARAAAGIGSSDRSA